MQPLTMRLTQRAAIIPYKMNGVSKFDSFNFLSVKTGQNTCSTFTCFKLNKYRLYWSYIFCNYGIYHIFITDFFNEHLYYKKTQLSLGPFLLIHTLGVILIRVCLNMVCFAGNDDTPYLKAFYSVQVKDCER